MSRGEIKIDQEKYKHNEDYCRYIQNYFKNDLVQPFTQGKQKNPEFIKRYGTKFYEKKRVKSNEQNDEQNNSGRKQRVILRRSKGSVFG